MKLLTRICRLAKAVFSDKRLNQIMCGMALFPVCLISGHRYLAFASAAGEHMAPFAVPTACIAALPWGLLLAILINLRERSFSASTTGISVGEQQEGEPPL